MTPSKKQLDVLREHITKTIEKHLEYPASKPKDIAKIIVQDVSWFYYENKEQKK